MTPSAGTPHRDSCKFDGCGNLAIGVRGLCRRHDTGDNGIGGICKYDDCRNVARVRGMCVRHEAGKKGGICRYDDCRNVARVRGMCLRHHAEVRRICTFDGCINLATARGVCRRHDTSARGTCKYDGCGNLPFNSRGMCKRHYTAIRVTAIKGICTYDGCGNLAAFNPGGVCWLHEKTVITASPTTMTAVESLVERRTSGASLSLSIKKDAKDHHENDENKDKDDGEDNDDDDNDDEDQNDCDKELTLPRAAKRKRDDPLSMPMDTVPTLGQTPPLPRACKPMERRRNSEHRTADEMTSANFLVTCTDLVDCDDDDDQGDDEGEGYEDKDQDDEDKDQAGKPAKRRCMAKDGEVYANSVIGLPTRSASLSRRQKPHHPSLSVDIVASLFEQYDLDGDGYLNYGELSEMNRASTSEEDLSEEIYLMVCRIYDCDPLEGLTLEALKLEHAKALSREAEETATVPEDTDGGGKLEKKHEDNDGTVKDTNNDDNDNDDNIAGWHEGVVAEATDIGASGLDSCLHWPPTGRKSSLGGKPYLARKGPLVEVRNFPKVATKPSSSDDEGEGDHLPIPCELVVSQNVAMNKARLEKPKAPRQQRPAPFRGIVSAPTGRSFQNLARTTEEEVDVHNRWKKRAKIAERENERLVREKWKKRAKIAERENERLVTVREKWKKRAKIAERENEKLVREKWKERAKIAERENERIVRENESLVHQLDHRQQSLLPVQPTVMRQEDIRALHDDSPTGRYTRTLLDQPGRHPAYDSDATALQVGHDSDNKIGRCPSCKKRNNPLGNKRWCQACLRLKTMEDETDYERDDDDDSIII